LNLEAKGKMAIETNLIYCGDNLEVLAKFPEKSVDLIYADPPFFSNRHFEIIWRNGAEMKVYADRWKGGVNVYIEWMKERFWQCHRVLADNGSMYLHCDWHATHRLRVAMDDIFGEDNFRNEIVWKRATMSGAKAVGKQYGRNHDSILYYSKSHDWQYHTQYLPYSKDYQIRKFIYRDENGRRYRLQPRGTRSDEAIAKFREQGRIVEGKSGYIEIKFYLDEMKGVALDDVWLDIKDLRTIQSTEKWGYPTQKPEALLKRIILTSSSPDDIVLDPFCGCGTTLSVAQQLGRRWIGIDVAPKACELVRERLNKVRATNIRIIGAPKTINELKELSDWEFQNWVIDRIGGVPSSKKADDKGVDGYTFMAREPVQVKQSEGVGRNVVDNFETAMRRKHKATGYIVAFSFGKGAYEEAARTKLEDNLDIKLIRVDELGKYFATSI